MSLSRRISLLVLCLPLIGAGPGKKPIPASVDSPEGLTIYRALPKDPLLLLGFNVEDAPTAFRGLVQLMGRFSSAEDRRAFAAKLGQMEGDAGLSDFLAQVGREVYLVFDVPPVDQAAGAWQGGTDELVRNLLGRTGLVASVHDGAEAERALGGMLRRLGGEALEGAGPKRVRVWFSSDQNKEDAARFSITFYYGARQQRVALGLSPEWVEAALTNRPEGERLVDGSDFARVFDHLDERPTALTYVNLPKLKALLDDSQILKSALASDPQARFFLQAVLESEVLKVGLGSTTVALDGGSRTTNFGPSWLSGGTVTSGLLAAVALPRLLHGIADHKTEETLSDIRKIAAACEKFSSDADGYPGPTEGWVPISRIAAYLEPVYLASLPRTDAWRNPILYWSDGGAFRIISTGQDGKMDRDWSQADGPAVQSGSDIVFGEKELVVMPPER